MSDKKVLAVHAESAEIQRGSMVQIHEPEHNPLRGRFSRWRSG
jgi:hypothetical protein